MNPVIKQLVLKDWQLYRRLIIFTVEGGAVALALLLFRRQTPAVLGSIFFFTALILVSSLLPNVSVMNERKKQTLPFMMSLPISSIQYTTAKLLATIGIFLTPWVALAAAAVWLIAGRGIFPHGVVPVTVILLLLPFLGCCIVTGVTLVGETEGWYIAANVVCNSSYGLAWYFIVSTPALARDLFSKVAVWSPTVLTVLAVEFALIVLTLALTFYLQSRKRDFI